MPTIRVDDDVFSGLQQLAEPFTDTPNTVIRRLLAQAGIPQGKVEQPKAGPKPARTTKGKLTQQNVYEKYLLSVLAAQFNGVGRKHEISRAVINLMERHGLIGPEEHEFVSTGESRAENTVAWARNALKDRGLISANSPRGTWEITAAGIAEASKSEVKKEDK